MKRTWDTNSLWAEWTNDGGDFLSPVIESESEYIINGLVVDFNLNEDVQIIFSFRSSPDSFIVLDNSIPWTGHIFSNDIEIQKEVSLSDIGVFLKGKYHQIKVSIHPEPESLELFSPLSSNSLNSLTISTGQDFTLLQPARAAFSPGNFIGQIIRFDGEQNVYKVSIDINITSVESKDIIEGHGDHISFYAANFQNSKKSSVWQPVINWGLNEWASSGTPISNIFQTDSYTTNEDVVTNAPMLEYKMLFPKGGLYHLWGYGYTTTDGSLRWGFDGDISHLKLASLGQQVSGFVGIPYWTKFGSVYFEEGGEHTFSVYCRINEQVVLDQWFFTQDETFDQILENNIGFETPLPISKCPFNTIVRLRSLNGDSLEDLENPSSGYINISAWQPSNGANASTKFNYIISDNITDGIDFVDGLSLEFWQIGGDRKYFASWNYSFNEPILGSSYYSGDFGKTINYD